MRTDEDSNQRMVRKYSGNVCIIRPRRFETMRWEYDRCLWKLANLLRRIRAEACHPVLLSNADQSDEAKGCGNCCRAFSLEARESQSNMPGSRPNGEAEITD